MKIKQLLVGLCLLLPVSVPVTAAGISKTSSDEYGYLFYQCNTAHQQSDNPSRYILEIQSDTSHILTQPICMEIDHQKQDDSNWAVALIPFFRLEDFKKQQIDYETIAQISTSQGRSNNGYSSYLIVNRDSDIYTLADLAHQKILASRRNSLSTSIYPTYVLGDYFKQHDIQLTYRPKSSADPLSLLTSNKVSAAFANEYLSNKNLMRQYRVILAFHWLPDYLVVVNNKIISQKQANTLKSMLIHQKAQQNFAFFKPNYELINAFNKIVDSNA